MTQQANARQGTHDTRTRGEVAGGGKKPYRQKGTGYARQGSKRAPHYRGGGVVFGPHPRSYEKAFPRKMRRLAMRSVLSARAAEDALTIVDAFTHRGGKTKALLATLAALGAADGALVVLGERSDPIFRAARNLDNVHVVTPNGLCLLDILRLPRMVADRVRRPGARPARSTAGSLSAQPPVRCAATLPPSRSATETVPSRAERGRMTLERVQHHRSARRVREEHRPRRPGQVRLRGRARRQQDPDQARRRRSLRQQEGPGQSPSTSCT